MALQNGQVDQDWLRKLNFYQNASPGAIDQYRHGYHTATPQETVRIDQLQQGIGPTPPAPLAEAMVGSPAPVAMPEQNQQPFAMPQPQGGLQSLMVPQQGQQGGSSPIQRLLSMFK